MKATGPERPLGRVAVIGVGNMGAAMAANLLRQGWQVQVCDLDAAKCTALALLGAEVIDSPAAVAADVQAVIIAVVDAAQTRDTLFGPTGLVGAGAGHQPGFAVLLCPTIAPAEVESLAADLAREGMQAIDAPMSGGPQRALEGRMSLMLAAPDDLLAAQTELLAALASQRFVISQRPGDGARTKLVNNLLAGINLVGAAECLALACQLGLDPRQTLDVMEQSSGQSWIGSDRLRRALDGDYAPRAHLTLLEKDTRLALAAAAEVGFTGPLGASASAVFTAAREALSAELDDAAVFQHLMRRARPPQP